MVAGIVPKDSEKFSLKLNNISRPHPSSFRDPSGGIVTYGAKLYRIVDESYMPHLNRLESSGLQRLLFEQRALIPHRVLDRPFPFSTSAATVLEPEPLKFVSHPYEWCFAQWKEAALLTLHLAIRAREHGMILKDASAYNVQFHEGAAVWIDTLSFESGEAPGPWVAYRQFCRHFLATLSAMSRIHPNWGQYFRSRMEGFDLGEVSKALPFYSWFNPFLAGHLHLQSRLENRPLKAGPPLKPPRMSETMLRGLLQDLADGIVKMRSPGRDTLWTVYPENLPYPTKAVEQKRRVVLSWIERFSPATLWDLGANTGDYSLEAASRVPFVLALDSDHGTVERLWNRVKGRGVKNLLPLWMDLANPSPAQGWSCDERSSLFQRGPADMVLALALVHHLAFTSLVPLERQAALFARCGRRIILEFPGPEDRQVKALCAGRTQLMKAYRTTEVERVFKPYFRIREKVALPDCARVLYLMENKGARS